MLRRMTRLAGAAAFGLGALILAASQAAAQADGLLCRRDEVLQVVARELRARDYYASTDFSTMLEQPTPEWNVVHCTVGVVRCVERCMTPWPRTVVVPVYGYLVRLANRRFTVVFDAY